MIDFAKELSEFNFLELDKDLTGMKYESSISIQSFSDMLKKMRKEQNEVNYQIEEIITVLEEIKSKDRVISELKESLESAEEENLHMVKSFIAVLDQVEDYYKYAQKHADKAWVEQFSLIWNNITNILLQRGIFRIEGENTMFDSRLYVAKVASYHDSLPEGAIAEVLKCGYIYKGHVLRKAEVMVNKRGNSGDTIE